MLVSLRDTFDGAGGPLCQAAALLHESGEIELVDEVFSCCGLDFNAAYYLVIEHRNHLIIMSQEPINIDANGKIVYDFTNKQSYEYDPFGFPGLYARQKELPGGEFCMFGANGSQTQENSDDTDITDSDRGFWEESGMPFGEYNAADYNLNGDVNVNDRKTWELNNGDFTSVPRD